MARIHLFGDEAGDFNFSSHPSASEYFILTTAAFFDDYQACRDLEELRLELAWEGIQHAGEFHATTDAQAIRDRVYETLAKHAFRVDATILQKRKAEPQLTTSLERFYQYAWFYHLKYLVPRLCHPGDELLIVAASIGTKAERAAFHAGVRDVVAQTAAGVVARTVHWPAAVASGLQVADYCGWAIQRRWERRDDRSHALISDKIASEFDLFRRSRTSYY